MVALLTRLHRHLIERESCNQLIDTAERAVEMIAVFCTNPTIDNYRLLKKVLEDLDTDFTKAQPPSLQEHSDHDAQKSG